MGMTMSQKILAAHAGLDHVEAGQLIEASLDLVLGNDVTAPVAINEFEKCGAKGVFSQDKIALVMDVGLDQNLVVQFPDIDLDMLSCYQRESVSVES